MFAARLATTIALLALFCGALLLLPNPYWAAFLLAGLVVAGLEWGTLAAYGRAARWMFVAIVAISAIGLMLDAAGAALRIVVYWGSLVFWLLIAPAWLLAKWRVGNALVMGITGWVVLVPTWLALARLQSVPGDLLAVLGIVWVADTAAYLAGRRFGRRRLAPQISPGKTWEGVLGAALAVGVYYWMLWFISGADWTLRETTGGALLFATVTAMSVQGDLFESWMKRQAGVKDSGTLLPGHGGILDRIDGLTAGIPLAALWLHYFGRPGLL